MFSRCLFLLVLIPLQACVSYEDFSVKLEEFNVPDTKKAILVLQTYALNTGFFSTSKEALRYHLSKVDSNYFDKDKKFHYVISPYSYTGPEVLMLDAGVYVLEELSWDPSISGRIRIESVKPGLLENGLVSYGAIKIEAGKIYDLGLLMYKYDSGKLLSKQDLSDKAPSELLLEEHPELKGKTIHKLKLIRSGTYLEIPQQKVKE